MKHVVKTGSKTCPPPPPPPPLNEIGTQKISDNIMKIIVLALFIEHYTVTATTRKCRSKYFVGQSVFVGQR